MSDSGWTTSAMNRCWISLQVSGISSSGAERMCSSARTTARQAWASTARVTQQAQEG